MTDDIKPGWKKIEEHPKDGTECWLSIWANNKPGSERIVVRGFLHPQNGRWVDCDDQEEIYPPTHFIIIYYPEPPAVDE